MRRPRPHGATNEFTFASLRNIDGFPGRAAPVPTSTTRGERRLTARSRARRSASRTRPTKRWSRSCDAESADAAHPRCTGAAHPELCQPMLNEAFLKTVLRRSRRGRAARSQHLPPVTHDWVVRRPAPRTASQPFVTSNQCMSCHAGLLAPFGPTMFVPDRRERRVRRPRACTCRPTASGGGRRWGSPAATRSSSRSSRARSR